MILSALANLRSMPVSLIKLCLIVTKLSTAANLLADNLVLAMRLGLIDSKRSTQLNKVAARFWLISILASLVRNVFDFGRIVAAERRQSAGHKSGVGLSRDVSVRSSVLSKVCSLILIY